MCNLSKLWHVKEECFISGFEDYKIIEDRSILSKEMLDQSSLKVELCNGLQVLLISNPSVSESGAAISIEAGAWDDPDLFPGMAHFVEHLLFLGTEKYPGEGEYSEYILERGGQYNAYTQHDHTTYGFAIRSSAFEGALDRLSRFFIDPIFSESAIEREKHAIHHEFEDSIENDFMRIWRIIKETGNQHHKNRYFSCGNLQSLEHAQRKEIAYWWRRHYHAEAMKLVMISNEPLYKLVGYANKFFSKIPSKQNFSEKERSHEQLLVESQKGHVIHVQSSFRNRSLVLLWEIPPEMWQNGGERALKVAKAALEYQITNNMQQDHLIKEVYVDFWNVEKNHGFFMIQVQLTPEGLNSYEQVVKGYFTQIECLQNSKMPIDIIDQIARFESKIVEYKFGTVFDAIMSTASELVRENLTTYPDQLHRMELLDLNLADLVLEKLTPEECVYFLISPENEMMDYPTRVEKWMHSKYFIRKIPEEFFIELKNQTEKCDVVFEILTEGKDQFSSLELEVGTDIEEVEDHSYLVEEKGVKIRFMKDLVLIDRVEAFFCLTNPIVYESPSHAVFGEMFTRAIQIALEEKFGGQVIWHLEIDRSQLCVFLSVPRNEYQKWFEQVFQVFISAKLSQEKFNEMKQEILEDYPGDPPPIDYAHQILDSLLRPFHYTKMEQYHSLFASSYDSYQNFEKVYFHELFIEGSFLGGVSREEALVVWDRIYGIVNPIPSSSGPYFDQLFQDTEQSYFFLEKTHRSGSALLLFISADEENMVYHKLLTMAIQHEFFEELRTRKQLAYRLSTWNEQIDSKTYHCFVLQSSTKHPMELLVETELFLNNLPERAEFILPKSRFYTLKDTLLFHYEKQKKNLVKKEDVLFLESTLQKIEQLEYSEILNGLKKIFSPHNRKRIAILVVSEEKESYEQKDLPYLPIEKGRFNRRDFGRIVFSIMQ